MAVRVSVLKSSSPWMEQGKLLEGSGGFADAEALGKLFEGWNVQKVGERGEGE